MSKRAIALVIVVSVTLATFAAMSEAYANESVKYIYDARGRLVRVERTGTINNNVKTKYELDRAGNRTRVTTTGKV